MTKAEIILINALDVGFAREGYIREKDIRTIKVQASIDTSEASLVIPEELCKKLGLAIKEEKFPRMIYGQRVNCKVTDMVGIRWKNREWSAQALVVPGAEEVFVGIQENDVEYYLSNFLESEKRGVKS